VRDVTDAVQTGGVRLIGLSKEDLIKAYRTMLLSRRIDEKQETLFKQGKIFFHVGGSGHEAAQIAAATALSRL